MTNPNFEWEKTVASLSRWRLQQRYQRADAPNIIATFVNGPYHNEDITMPRNSGILYQFPIYEKQENWWRTDLNDISPSKRNPTAVYRKIAEGLTYAIYIYEEEK